MGFAVFRKEPTSLEVRAFLGRAICTVGCAPKHLVSDKGSQFNCAAFRRWCKRRTIKPRHGAVGRYGSIAVIERFIRSLKNEWIRRILIPFNRQQMRRHLLTYARWYNHFRPTPPGSSCRRSSDQYADPTPTVIRVQWGVLFLVLDPSAPLRLIEAEILAVKLAEIFPSHALG